MFWCCSESCPSSPYLSKTILHRPRRDVWTVAVMSASIRGTKTIKRMLELRLNPVTSGVHTLAELITAPCQKCKGVNYSTKV